jgi:hypothetical protein
LNKFLVFVMIVTIIDTLIIIMLHSAMDDIECPQPVYVYSQEGWRRYWQMCEMSIRMSVMLPVMLVVNFLLVMIAKAMGME